MASTDELKIFEMQAELAGALAHPIRLRILDLLSEEEMATQDLLAILDIPKANLSQHILLLKGAGLLEIRKSGRSQYIQLALPRITEACKIVRELLMQKLELQQRHASELTAKFGGASQ